MNKTQQSEIEQQIKALSARIEKLKLLSPNKSSKVYIIKEKPCGYYIFEKK